MKEYSLLAKIKGRNKIQHIIIVQSLQLLSWQLDETKEHIKKCSSLEKVGERDLKKPLVATFSADSQVATALSRMSGCLIGRGESTCLRCGEHKGALPSHGRAVPPYVSRAACMRCAHKCSKGSARPFVFKYSERTEQLEDQMSRMSALR